MNYILLSRDGPTMARNFILELRTRLVDPPCKNYFPMTSS